MTADVAANPLRVGMRLHRAPDACAVVVFGATGDLTKRKLFPALYQLAAEHLIASGFAVLAVGRDASETDQSFREKMRGRGAAKPVNGLFGIAHKKQAGLCGSRVLFWSGKTFH